MAEKLSKEEFEAVAKAAQSKWTSLTELDMAIDPGSLTELARRVSEVHGIPSLTAHAQLTALLRTHPQ